MIRLEWLLPQDNDDDDDDKCINKWVNLTMRCASSPKFIFSVMTNGEAKCCIFLIKCFKAKLSHCILFAKASSSYLLIIYFYLMICTVYSDNSNQM